MEINLTGISAAESTNNSTTSTFKRVEPGINTLTITKLEDAKVGSKPVLRVTFSSKEADAEFSHDFFTQGNSEETSKKLLERIQYLIEKFSGSALQGNFSLQALSAVLVGKTKVCMVDGRIRGVQSSKDSKWYNNTYPNLAWAGYVDPSPDAKPYINDKDKLDVDALNASSGDATNIGSSTGNDLPF